MSLQSALALIDSVKDDRVLFIGETIIDEYRFVTPLAKPPKENVLAVRLRDIESYRGGVVAAMKHADSFCRAFASTLPNKIIKARYIEENYSRKLFEVQTIDGQITDEGRRLAQEDILLSGANVRAITDFGHGMFDAQAISWFSRFGFLAVACQTNAANHGFNLITKYPRADYIVIDEPEARLAAADRDSPIEAVMRKLAEGRCERFVVTHGKHGAYGLDHGRFLHAPALSRNVVDTMGAGDAFFAVTAPMARTGSMEDLLLIGNAAGALKCTILGHRQSVTKTALVEFLMNL
jgi:bifunctional ADP-heptose synthase (sugar kinase/adenylyltransferase)